MSSLKFGEFVALAAATMSTQAIAIDAMLPAFPLIVRSLDVPDPNHGQWIVTAYMTGLAIGQLFWGVMSDRYGRRPIMLSGLSVYVLAALACAISGSFETLLIWRFVHGMAAASVVVMRSVVRDLYSGRQMARVMSLTFMTFLVIPVIAPSLGQAVLVVAPWRFIFGVFCSFAAIVAVWLAIRLPETLHPEYRITLSAAHIARALQLVLGNRLSLCYTMAMTVMFGSLMAYVATVQQIFANSFHRADLMPGMFALCAIFMGMAAYGNSRIVERVGMRRISHAALLSFIGIAALHTVAAFLGPESMWSFVLFQSATMAAFGLSVSNFGAMAMEPVGAAAGLGAALQGFTSTFLGALVGAFIGRQFNGTTLPLAAGGFACGLAALLFVLAGERGRLFTTHHSPPNRTLSSLPEAASARPSNRPS